MRAWRVHVITVAAVVLVGATGRAEPPVPPAGTPAPGAPCAADLARFCKDTSSGQGRIRACLLSHAKELAPECRVRIGTVAAGPPMGAPEMVACERDLATHCPGVPSGGGRLRACLEEHAGAVTAACKAALARPPQPRKRPGP